MKNHPADFDTPFGAVVPLPSNSGVLATCSNCDWQKTTGNDTRKHWSAASRGRMGLQLHAIAKHADQPEVQEYIR